MLVEGADVTGEGGRWQLYEGLQLYTERVESLHLPDMQELRDATTCIVAKV